MSGAFVASSFAMGGRLTGNCSTGLWFGRSGNSLLAAICCKSLDARFSESLIVEDTSKSVFNEFNEFQHVRYAFKRLHL